jgi:hypothetical protein
MRCVALRAVGRRWEWVGGTRFDYGHQFVNCRNRMGPSQRTDAGNYLLTHCTEKEQFVTPRAMRATFKALDKEVHYGAATGGFTGKYRLADARKLRTSNFGAVSNWCTSNTTIHLPDCELVRTNDPYTTSSDPRKLRTVVCVQPHVKRAEC